MQSQTRELLCSLLWMCHAFSKPTWQNMTDSFEAWAYRTGLDRQLYKLQRQNLVESQLKDRGQIRPGRLLRLTEAGRVAALGGRDPQIQWNRRWDGRWRLVLFDVPLREGAARDRLRRYLQQRHFGQLQKSVWLTPDPLDEEKNFLKGQAIDVGSLIFLQGESCGGETKEDIVRGAWDFCEIHRRYEQCMDVIDDRPTGPPKTEAETKEFLEWSRQEHAAWFSAVSIDPLLPQALLPKNYLGIQTWRLRTAVSKEFLSS